MADWSELPVLDDVFVWLSRQDVGRLKRVCWTWHGAVEAWWRRKHETCRRYHLERVTSIPGVALTLERGVTAARVEAAQFAHPTFLSPPPRRSGQHDSTRIASEPPFFIIEMVENGYYALCNVRDEIQTHDGMSDSSALSPDKAYQVFRLEQVVVGPDIAAIRWASKNRIIQPLPYEVLGRPLDEINIHTNTNGILIREWDISPLFQPGRVVMDERSSTRKDNMGRFVFIPHVSSIPMTSDHVGDEGNAGRLDGHINAVASISPQGDLCVETHAEGSVDAMEQAFQQATACTSTSQLYVATEIFPLAEGQKDTKRHVQPMNGNGQAVGFQHVAWSDDGAHFVVVIHSLTGHTLQVQRSRDGQCLFDMTLDTTYDAVSVFQAVQPLEEYTVQLSRHADAIFIDQHGNINVFSLNPGRAMRHSPNMRIPYMDTSALLAHLGDRSDYQCLPQDAIERTWDVKLKSFTVCHDDAIVLCSLDYTPSLIKLRASTGTEPSRRRKVSDASVDRWTSMAFFDVRKGLKVHELFLPAHCGIGACYLPGFHEIVHLSYLPVETNAPIVEIRRYKPNHGTYV